MKTYIVQPVGGTGQWMGNAENPVEAVQYAVAHSAMFGAEAFRVVDFDANVTEVERIVKTESPAAA